MTTDMIYSAFFRTFTDMDIHTLIVFTHYDDMMNLTTLVYSIQRRYLIAFRNAIKEQLEKFCDLESRQRQHTRSRRRNTDIKIRRNFTVLACPAPGIICPGIFPYVRHSLT